MATRASKKAGRTTYPPPPDRQALPTDAEQWAREYIGGLEDTRREHLVARQLNLAVDLQRFQDVRQVMAKQDNVPPEVFALIDDAIAATRHDAENVEASLRAVKEAPELEPGGYALVGVLATSAGKGPADGTAALVIAAADTSAKVATARIGPDGSLYLVLPAATAKQYAGQSAAVEITLAKKPFPINAKVTVTPGQVETVRLPVLPDETRPKGELYSDYQDAAPAGPAAAEAAPSEVQAEKPSGTEAKGKRSTGVRNPAKKDQPES
jgi:hypothetical protein